MENLNTLEFITPSKLKVVIREQNGADDDVLSNAKATADGSSINNFLQGIILSIDDKKPTKEDILNLKLRDKYVIILHSRIYSIGQIMSFEYNWGDGVSAEYEEDLGKYIMDYSQTVEVLSKDVIPPYLETANERILILESGKKVRYKYANGYTERYLVKLPPDQLTKNSELFARELSQEVGPDNWVKVQNFSTFSTSDMRQIRSDIQKYDPPVNLISEIKHPHDSTQVLPIMILSNINSFFFPARA